jgi:toxin YoeB
MLNEQGKTMILYWIPKAWDDYLYWQENDEKIMRHINELIKSIETNPCRGVGNPKLLEHKHNNDELWSRTINREHCIIYKIKDYSVVILQCKFKYVKG